MLCCHQRRNRSANRHPQPIFQGGRHGVATGANAAVRISSARIFCAGATREDLSVTIPPELEAQILRYYHAEKWTTGTIAAQLGVHRTTVIRVLSQAGLPRTGRDYFWHRRIRADVLARLAAGPGYHSASWAPGAHG